MIEKYTGPDRRQASESMPVLTPEILKELEIRPDPRDHLFDVEKNISFREKIESLQTVVEQKIVAGGKEDVGAEWALLPGLLTRLAEGPVFYLEMPYRYNREGFRKTAEEWRGIQEYYRTTNTEVDRMLENQRLGMASFAALLRPIIWALMNNVGEKSDWDDLHDRFNILQQKIVAKRGLEDVDHRIMTLEEKDEVVREASLLAQDVLRVGIKIVESRLSS